VSEAFWPVAIVAKSWCGRVRKSSVNAGAPVAAWVRTVTR
jgi:hypothetical protein